VVRCFERFSWPGNLRQLINVLHAAVALAGRAGTIERDHLPEAMLEDTPADTPDAVAAQPPDAAATLHDLELAAIRRAVAEAGGNISRASQRLGISRNTLYRKLRASGAG
jgi:transcriptional regulator of acetoin/glycerol metabolism